MIAGLQTHATRAQREAATIASELIAKAGEVKCLKTRTGVRRKRLFRGEHENLCNIGERKHVIPMLRPRSRIIRIASPRRVSYNMLANNNASSVGLGWSEDQLPSAVPPSSSAKSPFIHWAHGGILTDPLAPAL